MIFGGLAFLAAVLALSTTATNSAEMLVRNSVRLSLTWYSAALMLMMHLAPRDWRVETRLGQITRWCWSWAVFCFLIHLCLAFHYYHYWSHQHAYDVTENTSGVGEGIYTLYIFVGLGLIDAAWWWTRPLNYASRSPYIDRVLHTFMLFIVFNGMVVFERGPIRWAGLVMFAVFAITWLITRGISTRQPA